MDVDCGGAQRKRESRWVEGLAGEWQRLSEEAAKRGCVGGAQSQPEDRRTSIAHYWPSSERTRAARGTFRGWNSQLPRSGTTPPCKCSERGTVPLALNSVKEELPTLLPPWTTHHSAAMAYGPLELLTARRCVFGPTIRP